MFAVVDVCFCKLSVLCLFLYCRGFFVLLAVESTFYCSDYRFMYRFITVLFNVQVTPEVKYSYWYFEFETAKCGLHCFICCILNYDCQNHS